MDSVLKRLNLGISSWVHFSGGRSPDDSAYYYEDVGYAKPGGRWGLAIRTVSGDYNDPDNDTVETWPFNEAPRLLRVRAILKVPELLDQLVEDATGIIKTVKERAETVDALATAIDELAPPVRMTNVGEMMSAAPPSAKSSGPPGSMSPSGRNSLPVGPLPPSGRNSK